MPTSRLLPFALASALAVAGLPASAQSDTNASPSQIQSPMNDAAMQGEMIPRIDFKGGTLRDLVAELRQVPETSESNIILKRQAGELEVEPFTLRRVTLRSLLNFVVPSQEYARTNEDGTTEIVNQGYKVITHPQTETGMWIGARPIHIIDVRTQEHTSPFPQSTSSQLTVLPLGPINDNGDSIEIFLDLALRALEMSGGPEPEFSFHEPSGMLIVRSTHHQQDTLHEVHELFTQQVINAQNRKNELRGTILSLEDELFEDQKTFELLEAERLTVSNQIQKLTEDEAERARQRVKELGAIMKQLAQQITRTKRELSSVQEQLD